MRMTRDMNAIYVYVYILIYMNKPKDPILSVLSTYEEQKNIEESFV